MPRRYVVLVRVWAAFLGLFFFAGPCLAAGGLPLFEDDFSSSGTTWGQPNRQVQFGDGRLTITADTGLSYTVFERRRSFDAVEFSAKTRFDSAPDGPGGKVGLAFWVADAHTFYVFLVTQEGRAGVWRIRDGHWTAVIAERPVPALRSGPAAENVLSVVTRGSKASMLLNGTDFVSITGQPPAGPRYIGFFGESPAAGAAAVSVSEPSVTLPDSITAGTIYAGLIRDGLADFVPEGFTVDSVSHNLTPERGIAEIAFALTGEEGASGTILYRFYDSEAAAKAYLGDDVRQPYADEAQGEAELLNLGHSNFEGDSTEYRWISKMLPKPGAEWIRSIALDGSLVVIATIELPRPKVRADADLRDGSLERAIRADASALQRAQAIEAAMPRP